MLQRGPRKGFRGPSLVCTCQLRYDGSDKERPGVSQVKLIKRQVLWIFVLITILSGCQPLEDLGKVVEDLLKRVTG